MEAPYATKRFRTTSTGSGSAGTLPQAGADGKLHASWLPDSYSPAPGGAYTVSYEVANAADWNSPVPETVGDALDELAAREGGGGATTADAVSADSTGFAVATGSTVQAVLASVDSALLRARSTGVRTGGLLSGVGTTTISITAGVGGILDNTDPSAPTFTLVEWAAQTITGITANRNWVYIDSAGIAHSQTTEPTPSEFRTQIQLGRASTNGGVISGIDLTRLLLQQYSAQIYDVFRAIGLVKTGMAVGASGANLNVVIGAGSIFSPGANVATSWTNPNEITFPGFDTAGSDRFRMFTQTGQVVADVATLPVGYYAPAGTVTAIPGSSGRATIFTVFRFANGNVRILYGKEYYSSSSVALTALASYVPARPQGLADAIIVGYIIASKGTTSLQDASTVYFVTTNQFGGKEGGVATSGSLPATSITYDGTSSGSSATTVQGAIDDLYASKAPKASPTFTGTVNGANFYGDVFRVLDSADAALAQFYAISDTYLYLTAYASGGAASNVFNVARATGVFTFSQAPMYGAYPLIHTNSTGAVTSAMLRNSAAYSVIGRATGSIGAPADIAAGVRGRVLGLRQTGDLAFVQVEHEMLLDDIVDNDILANMPAYTVKLNPNGTAGGPQDFALGTNGVLGRLAGAVQAVPIGTSGEVLPLLNANNVYSGSALFSGNGATTIPSVCGTAANMALVGTGGSTTQFSLVRYGTGTNACPTVALGKVNNAAVASHGAVVDGMRLGQILLGGDDGTADQTSVRISAEVSGTVASAKVPGKFKVETADANGALTEGLAIGPKQRLKVRNLVGVGGLLARPAGYAAASGTVDTTVYTAPANLLQEDGDGLYIRIPIYFANNANAKRVRVGVDGIGGTNAIGDTGSESFGSSAAVSGTIEIWVVRTSSTTVDASMRTTIHGRTTGPIEDFYSGTTWDATGARAIVVRTVSVAANDITVRGTGGVTLEVKPT